MSIRKAITLASALALTVLPLIAIPANARSTRELVTSFGSFEGGTITGGGLNLVTDGVTGLAVDLETGNVYVADNRTQTIYIFGVTGGAPSDHVPSQITGVYISTYFEPTGLAVDNSCYEHEPRLTGKTCEEYDPSYGDVYIMDNNNDGSVWGIQKFKLTSGGKYELAGEIDHPQGVLAPIGVAVDSRGDVYMTIPAGPSRTSEAIPVLEFKKVVEKVVNGGIEEFQEKLEELSLPQNITGQAGYVAVDDFGNVYVGSGLEDSNVAKLKVDGSGAVVSEEVLAGPSGAAEKRPLAVDLATGGVYVGDGSEVAEYNAAGEPQLTFGSTEPLGGSLGKLGNGVNAIAVNGPAGLIYVANELHGDVDVFGGVVSPPVIEGSQPPVSSVTRASALVAGTANPGGSGNYYFEYVAGSEYDPTAGDPYGAGGRTAIAALPAGHTPQTVERVALTGLLAGTTYHYRMVVSNAAQTTYGPDETFTTVPATPPLASTGPASEVGATSATLSGVVAPQGLPTSYVFEIGTDTGYEGAKLFGNAGSSTGEVPVTVSLQYLVPGMTYHYRLVAVSFDGTGYGRDGTFTTPGVPPTVVQPAALPLIASPAVVFPSIAGAITKPAGAGKPKKKSLTGAQRLASVLAACRKHDRPGRRRSACEAQARSRVQRALVKQRSKKKR